MERRRFFWEGLRTVHVRNLSHSSVNGTIGAAKRGNNGIILRFLLHPGSFDSDGGVDARGAAMAASARVLFESPPIPITVNPTWVVPPQPPIMAPLPASNIPILLELRIGNMAVLLLTVDVADLRQLSSPIESLKNLPLDAVLFGVGASNVLYAPRWVAEAFDGAGKEQAPGTLSDDMEEDIFAVEKLGETLAEAETTVMKARDALELRLLSSRAQRSESAEEEKRAVSTCDLRLRLASEKHKLEVEEAAMEQVCELLASEAADLKSLMDEVQVSSQRLSALREVGLASSKGTALQKIHLLMNARRARLASELRKIYPISVSSSSGCYAIRDLEMPEDLASIDDEIASSALGYAAHVSCMLAKYMGVSLRYYIKVNASRSSIQDLTSGGLAFPLYRRGVERERFDRAVMLLAKDVEQLLCVCGVEVEERGAPREPWGGASASNILANLHVLMQHFTQEQSCAS